MLSSSKLAPGSLRDGPYPPLAEILAELDSRAASLTVIDGADLSRRAGAQRALNVVMLGGRIGAGSIAR